MEEVVGAGWGLQGAWGLAAQTKHHADTWALLVLRLTMKSSNQGSRAWEVGMWVGRADMILNETW